ncbi:ABC-type antimicrobial peptide transport system, permease component [Chryseolinea serpens]|uniref:ABC-type antimicrobial peptide transport system, permease component n=1 Tax=Chryseolinea serpens TaxID=947013 RepID=A0A1M5WT77_9BACT|nr:ABC transporter permease [Chryseolinea serpens]SHH90243.1 ABC-type antimicrobial peptide transport system, permease component [Chryseolinea serpens]
MLLNYLKIALRNLLRNSSYSIINIGGLGVGMAVAMLIGLWVFDEISYNSYLPEYQRVAQVYQHQTINARIVTQDAVPYPLGGELQKVYGSDFKYIVMSSWTNSHILSRGDTSITKMGNFMDVDAGKLLALKMIAGTRDGLRDPNSILLSQSVAHALFGDKDPINALLKLDTNLDVKVTGVYEDIPPSNFDELTFIVPWELYTVSQPWVKNVAQSWGTNSFQCFVQMADHAEMTSLSRKIIHTKYNRVDPDDRKFNAEIFLHPMSDWHLHSQWENGVPSGGLIEYVWLFGITGAFVLLLACINFMNLSTARSEQRAKEVGIRKSIGSLRKQLITQFMSESLLVVCLAFMVTIILVSLSLPTFNTLSGKQMTLPFDRIGFWVISVSFMIITGVLAGSYPALYLSSFQPVKVLKGVLKAGRYAALPRRILVVVQFTVSVTLIIGTLVVYRQIQFTKDRPVGYDRNGIVMLQQKSPQFQGKFDVLRNELKRTGAAQEVAESSSPLTGVWSNNGGFDWEGKDPALQADFATVWITSEYGKTVDWKVVDGRDFSSDMVSDTTAIIINQAAIKFMGIEDPVGKTVDWGEGYRYKIIGVVSDLLMGSPFHEVKQTIYFKAKENNSWMILKLNPALSTHEALSRAEQVFKQYLPGVPFDYMFADVEHAQKFASEERIGTLSGIFAGLAVFISCLGLLGLASFVAEQRTKEIGIRKVLGASVASLWQMLSKDFVILVLAACVIAIPLSYYFTQDWLKNYPYHTTISWWLFAATIAGAVVLTLMMVSFQAIKAALSNPVRSLRSE